MAVAQTNNAGNESVQSDEVLKLDEIRQLVAGSLQKAFEVHELLGERGVTLVSKNQFGETALTVDIEAEKVVLDFLRQQNFPIRVVSEEHGTVDITENPRFLGVLDGLDGSSVYKEKRGFGRYGTMFGVFDTTNPRYGDYLASGVMEHSTKKLFIASRGAGAHVVLGGENVPIMTSGKTALNLQTEIYVDKYHDVSRTIFADQLGGFQRVRPINAYCISYIDVAFGAADIVLACTCKGNLEPAVAFGLIAEAGGIVVDMEGKSLANRRYFDFGQSESLPIITTATPELASELIAFIRK